MARLPVSRVVDVTLSKLDRFATRQGFGVPLVITSVAQANKVDATTRTKVYGSMEEVAADFTASTEAYKAALAMFSQNPRPRQIKIGYIAPGTFAASPAPLIADELDALYGFDPDWYWVTFTKEFRDKPVLDDAFAWVDGKRRHMHVDSNDVKMEDASDTTNVAARNKLKRTRTGIFYHTDATAYAAAALIGFCARRDFDRPNDAYTAKFKKLIGIGPINKGSAAVQAVTGFIPAIGLDSAQGHYANTYVNIGGLDMVVEGSMLDGGFIDELHAADWIIARTEEEMLSALANNARIAYTNKGIQILVSAVETVLNRARVAGLIAETTDPETGDLLPEYEISVERVENIPATQRRQRIAPVIDAKFRYAGAVHYTSARFTMAF